MGQPVAQIPGFTTKRIFPQTDVCHSTEVFLEVSDEAPAKTPRVARTRCSSWPATSPCETLTASDTSQRALTSSRTPPRALLPTVSLYERQLKLNKARTSGASLATVGPARTTSPSTICSTVAIRRMQRYYQSATADRTEALYTPPGSSPINTALLGTIGAEIMRKPNHSNQQNTLPKITAKTCRLFDKSAKETNQPKSKVKEEQCMKPKFRIEKLVISLPTYDSFSSPSEGFTVALKKNKCEPRTKSTNIVRGGSYDFPFVQEHRVNYE